MSWNDSCVCKPCPLLAVSLLVQSLSYVFIVTFIHFNLQAVNTFVMKRIKLHKLCVKPLKSCYRTIHHLPILITKALHHLLLVDNMRKRGKRKKKKESDNTEWSWENRQNAEETWWWCWRTKKKERRHGHDRAMRLRSTTGFLYKNMFSFASLLFLL